MFVKLAFYIVSLIAKLPEKVLYTFSDFVYYLVYYLIRYRKKLVFSNLRNSFPGKSDKEIEKIAKEFYRNFCDSFIESLQTISLPLEKLHPKMTVGKNFHYIEEAYRNKQDMAILLGHLFNWEWFAVFTSDMLHKNIYGIYKPIKNKFINDKMAELRFKFGAKGISSKETMKFILAQKNTGQNVYVLASDQSPKKSRIEHSLKFLNQETPIFSGFDILIRENKLAVVVAISRKISRGKYTADVYKISPDAEEFRPYEAAQKYYEILEEAINKDPANWLWTHRRWKFKKGRDY